MRLQWKKLGKFIIDEATQLTNVHKQYDFIIASHVLEHIANPLLALEQWKRILKPNGLIILILPWKEKIHYTIRRFNHSLSKWDR